MTYSLVQTTLGRGYATPAFERITNGTFDLDLTGWTGSATWRKYDGAVEFNSITTGPLSQAVFIQAGRAFSVSFDENDNDNSSVQPTITIAAYNGMDLVQDLIVQEATGGGSYSASGVLLDTATSIEVSVDLGDATYIILDNISVVA